MTCLHSFVCLFTHHRCNHLCHHRIRVRPVSAVCIVTSFACLDALHDSALSLLASTLYHCRRPGYADGLELGEDGLEGLGRRWVTGWVVLLQKRGQEVHVLEGLVGTLSEMLWSRSVQTEAIIRRLDTHRAGRVCSVADEEHTTFVPRLQFGTVVEAVLRCPFSHMHHP